jgi:hypothetical protein
MRETRTSGLMSGDGKRSDAHAAQATAPVLDSTRGGAEVIEQLPRVPQVRRVQALGEPGVNRLQDGARLIAPALVAPEPG